MTAWQVVKKKKKVNRERSLPFFLLPYKSFTKQHFYFIPYQQNLYYLVIQAVHTFYNSRGKSVLANRLLLVLCSFCWKALPCGVVCSPTYTQSFTDTSGRLLKMSESNILILLSRSDSFSAAIPVEIAAGSPSIPVATLEQILWHRFLSLGVVPARWLWGGGKKRTAVLCSLTWLPNMHISLLSWEHFPAVEMWYAWLGRPTAVWLSICCFSRLNISPRVSSKAMNFL